jgi:hypothetical protein
MLKLASQIKDKMRNNDGWLISLCFWFVLNPLFASLFGFVRFLLRW